MTWKKVNKDYAVSSDGRVRSFKYGKVRELIPIHNGGYLKVKINNVVTLIHRLVALAFIPNPHEKSDVNHINGDKLDNRVMNLEWVTRRENLHHAMANGLHANPFHKVKCIETGEVFESLTAAAGALGVFQPNISKVVRGERKHTGGYTFKRVG